MNDNGKIATIDTGGPAFPWGDPTCGGMTLRQYYVGKIGPSVIIGLSNITAAAFIANGDQTKNNYAQAEDLIDATFLKETIGELTLKLVDQLIRAERESLEK